MSVKLLTEHHLEFLSLKEAVQARLSLHVSTNCEVCDETTIIQNNFGNSFYIVLAVKHI